MPLLEDFIVILCSVLVVTMLYKANKTRKAIIEQEIQEDEAIESELRQRVRKKS